MPISNTARLSQGDVDSMNNGIRRIGYAGNPGGGLITDDEINGEPVPKTGDYQSRRRGLAEYFGVVPSTIKGWLVPADAITFPFPRRCIPQRDQTINTTPPRRIYGGIGRRPYCLTSALLSGKTDPLNNLRQRIFLCAALAVPSGLQRIPLFHGDTRQTIKRLPTLSDALDVMYGMWNGNDGVFVANSWIQFTIRGAPGRWELVVDYNMINRRLDGSDPTEEEDESQNIQADGTDLGPDCP